MVSLEQLRKQVTSTRQKVKEEEEIQKLQGELSKFKHRKSIIRTTLRGFGMMGKGLAKSKYMKNLAENSKRMYR